jgi:glycopeptide antibiotics resistance protein
VLGVGLLAGSIVVITLIVFPWATLQDHAHWSKVRWIPFVSPPTPLLDMLANLLLFAPLGAGASLLGRRGIAGAILLGLTLSLVGEWAQVYAHSRTPSATDVVCNVAGALAAALVVKWVLGRT